MSWHAWILAAFVVGMSVYVVSNLDVNYGWVYVLLLLLGISLLHNNFKSELSKLGNSIPYAGGNLPFPVPSTGAPGGPNSGPR